MDLLIEKLRAARRVTVLTGAGVSAASGVPTFRGASGMWKQFRVEQLATPEAFARDPASVWEWYDWRRRLIAEAEPNDAHRVLARWEARFPDFTLVTQNVDGLHERAGSTRIVRYHGSIWRLRCAGVVAGLKACATQACAADWEDLRAPLPSLPPTCPHCGALARPGVVWFGEPIPAAAIRDSSRAAASCDVFLMIGTSAIVYPAAGLLHEAAYHGAFTAEINVEATDASPAVDLAIQGKAEKVLAEIDARLEDQGTR
ncbi:MAG TPA: NAD-dependent deacylase [Vicinamibacterales bacterium]